MQNSYRSNCDNFLPLEIFSSSYPSRKVIHLDFSHNWQTCCLHRIHFPRRTLIRGHVTILEGDENIGVNWCVNGLFIFDGAFTLEKVLGSCRTTLINWLRWGFDPLNKIEGTPFICWVVNLIVFISGFALINSYPKTYYAKYVCNLPVVMLSKRQLHLVGR